MKIVRSTLFLLLIASLGQGAWRGVFAAPLGFDQAVADYKNQQYSLALSHFQQINRAHPSDVETHYYMALCYQCLSQIAAARQEYSWVYTYAKNQGLRYNAYQALVQLQKAAEQRKIAGRNLGPRHLEPSIASGRFMRQFEVTNSIAPKAEDLPAAGVYCPVTDSYVPFPQR